MCAFDLPDGKARADFQEKLFEENVIVLICGEKSIRFRPHLNVTQEDLQFALDKIEKIASTTKTLTFTIFLTIVQFFFLKLGDFF